MKRKTYIKIALSAFLCYLVWIGYRAQEIKSIHNGKNSTSNKEDPKGNYYFTFGHVKEKNAISLDSNQVYVVDYKKIKSISIEKGIQYNPVTIALNALRAYQRFHDHQLLQDSIVFMANANWLLNNQTKDGSWVLNHDVMVGEERLKAPWSSALSQGLGMSVLCRASELNRDTRYLATAQKAFEPFLKEVSKGGVCSISGEGLFFEEYPVGDSGSHVLNGHVYALFGLYDLWLFDQNTKAKELFEKGVVGLENYLPDFDAGHWSRYSLSSTSQLSNHYNLSSPWYQKLHAVQLQSLMEMTGNSIFDEYAERFRHQHEQSPTSWIIYPIYIVYVDLVWVLQLFP